MVVDEAAVGSMEMLATGMMERRERARAKRVRGWRRGGLVDCHRAMVEIVWRAGRGVRFKVRLDFAGSSCWSFVCNV